jgi:hypothetical protein
LIVKKLLSLSLSLSLSEALSSFPIPRPTAEIFQKMSPAREVYYKSDKTPKITAHYTLTRP